MTVEVTETTFDREVGSSPTPVVVEFYATWCGNCRRIAPVLDELADEFEPRVRLLQVNADENPDLVSRFGVSSTPTLFVLAGGDRVTSVVGAQPAPVLRALFDTAAGLAQPTEPAAGARLEDAVQEPGPDARATVGWVPAEACTLPTADRPARLAEFEGLFTSSLLGIRRESSDWLQLRLDGGADVESHARDLTAREAECCAFFNFTVGRDGDQVIVDVRVPADKELVLDGLAMQAEAVLAARV